MINIRILESCGSFTCRPLELIFSECISNRAFPSLCRKYAVTFFFKNYQFKLKFGIQTNLNKRNSMMMMFNFAVLDNKYFSWAGLVQKFKIACSK